MKRARNKDHLTKQGLYLREQRLNAGLGLIETAKTIGMSKQWLSDVERGLCDIFFEDVCKLALLYPFDLNAMMRYLADITKENDSPYVSSSVESNGLQKDKA